MNTFRNIVSWISLYLVGVGFFISANLFVLFTVINSDNLKQTFKEEDVYSQIVPSALSATKYSNDITSMHEQKIPVNEAWVKEAANKAFPANQLEQQGSTVIDSTFAWLSGETETDTPEFTIDLTSNKQVFGQEVAAYTENRLTSLPRCETFTIPDSIDTFTATCIPFGVNPALLSNQVENQVNSNDGFLGEPVINSSDIFNDDTVNKLGSFQPFYKHKDLLLWGAPILTVMFAAIGVVAARNRSKAVRRLTRSMISGAIGLLIIGLSIGIGLKKALESINKDVVGRDLVVPVLSSLLSQAAVIYWIFSGIGIVVGIVLWIVRVKILKSKPVAPVAR